MEIRTFRAIGGIGDHFSESSKLSHLIVDISQQTFDEGDPQGHVIIVRHIDKIAAACHDLPIQAEDPDTGNGKSLI